MTSSEALHPSSDELSELLTLPSTFADPFPVYARLFEHSPLRFLSLRGDGSMGRTDPVYSWAVLGYHDACAVLSDYATFSSKDMLAGQFGPRLALIDEDPPRHGQLRRISAPFFTPAALTLLEPALTAVASRLLEGFGAHERDFIDAFAAPLPGLVIARLLGIPEEQHASLRRWTDAFITTLPLSAAARMREVRQMVQYLEQTVGNKTEQASTDLIGALATAHVDGKPLERAEVVGYCVLLLIAGNETSTRLLGSMLALLAERPELWSALRADRSLIGPVIEETLRYQSPVQRSAFRTATRDVVLAGAQIAKGDRLTVFYGAANHDPRVFEQAEEFRPGRGGPEHIAFGLGPHFCLGAHLGRLEARVSLNLLLDRFESVAPGETPPERQTLSPTFFGYTKLPLRFG